MEKIIAIKNLTKVFGKKSKTVVALDKVNLDIYRGQNIALVGANGAGKTTLIEILAGINKPTKGNIKYFLPKGKKANEAIGIQFQDSFYPNGLSVKNIIDFTIDAYSSTISTGELNHLIDVFGIRSFYKKNARSLSGGQSQRLNVLLALLHKPEIVFLDELSTGLDITIRTEIKNFIKEWTTNNNINIVLVSHDINEIDYLVDRIVVFKKGKIIKDLTKSKIIKSYKSVENFITKFTADN